MLHWPCVHDLVDDVGSRRPVESIACHIRHTEHAEPGHRQADAKFDQSLHPWPVVGVQAMSVGCGSPEVCSY